MKCSERDGRKNAPLPWHERQKGKGKGLPVMEDKKFR
jgi:hypothetical protein